MKVLIAIYPFLSRPQETGDVEFIVNPWGRDPSADEIEEELARGEYAGLIVGTKTVKNSILHRTGTLKVISRVGVGYNNIDVPYFKDNGVVTTYTPFGPTDSTAEMALAMIMAGTRRLANYDRMIRDKQWNRSFNIRLMDATVGIVGFGRIGKRLATLLKPFGCKIILNDIKPDLATAHALDLPFVDKEELLEKADVISFHVPLKQDTVNWLSAGELSSVKKAITIVNTARGGIVNEAAVYSYLKSHPESYYCCDTFEEEPYTGFLIELDNVLLTPHASSFTVGSRLQTEELAIENCLQVLRGLPCSNVVEENEQ